MTSLEDQIGPVRQGDELDWVALERHVRGLVDDLPDSPMVVQQFTGGHANLTYQLTFGQRRLVFRRPPRGVIAPGAHDMGREHRVLSRLWRSYPRAPRSFVFCDDDSIVGAPFVILEHRDGVVVRQDIPPSMVHHHDVARRVNLALIEATADLHAIDVEAAELGDLGRPEGFGDRQVAGWRDRWNRAAPTDDVDGSTAMNEVAEALAATVPAPPRVSLVHNDLKLDNCQFDPANPDIVTSVFDWDMATLGNPLFDLGAMFTSMAASPLWVVSLDDALARYSERSGIDVGNFAWYRAFATFRKAVVMQQLYNRYASGQSSDDTLAGLGRLVPGIADEARALLTGEGGSTTC